MVDATVELDAMKAALEALTPLNQDQAARALRWLSEALQVSPPLSASTSLSAPTSFGPFPPASHSISAAPYSPTAPYESGAQSESPSPKAFLALKRPKGNAEKIACLAFYLSEFRQKPHFKAPDIVALNTEAAQPKLGNPSRDVDNADRGSGYLASAGNGYKQISARGEALVHALPERGAAQSALKEHPIRRRKSPTKKAGDTKENSDSTENKPRSPRKRTTPTASGLPKP